MGRLYNRIKNAKTVILKNLDKSEREGSETKACTVRLHPSYLQAIDKLADGLNLSRQQFMADLIYDAVEEAINAYAAAYDDPKKVRDDLFRVCKLTDTIE